MCTHSIHNTIETSKQICLFSSNGYYGTNKHYGSVSGVGLPEWSGVYCTPTSAQVIFTATNGKYPDPTLLLLLLWLLLLLQPIKLLNSPDDHTIARSLRKGVCDEVSCLNQDDPMQTNPVDIPKEEKAHNLENFYSVIDFCSSNKVIRF